MGRGGGRRRGRRCERAEVVGWGGKGGSTGLLLALQGLGQILLGWESSSCEPPPW